MIALIRLLNGRHIRRQWIRALLSLVGVAVGVGCFIFAPTLTITISGAVDLTRSDLSGRADLEVRASDGAADVSLLDTIRQTKGAIVAAPFSQHGGFVVGQPEMLMIVGIDPAVDLQVRDYTLSAGTFLSGSGGVLLGIDYAREKKLEVGSKIQVLSVGGMLNLTVQGILSGESGFGRLNGGDILVLGIQDALSLRGVQQFEMISILLDPTLDQTEVINTLRAVLPDSVLIDAPEQRYQGTAQFSIVLNLLIGVICSLILGMGAVLIYNAMAISVAQRRGEIGLLRAVGATREQVRRLYLIESLILGTVGSVAGIFLGYLMVSVGKDLPVIPEFTHSSALTSRGQISVPDGLWLIALIAGTAITVLAGYLPARTASWIDPVEAMIQIRAETGRLRFSLRRVLWAALMIGGVLIGMALIPAGTMEGIFFGNMAIYVVLTAMVLVVAPLMSILATHLPPLMYRAWGAVGMIAADNVMRRPKRMLVTATFVMFGCAMALQVSGTNFGYQSYIQEWASAENLGDLIVMGPTRDPLRPSQPIPSDMIETITQRPEVAGFYTERFVTHEQDGLIFLIRAIDMAPFQALGGHFPWAVGEEAAAYARLADPNQPVALVNASLIGTSNGVVSGKQVELNAPTGKQTLDILGAILGVIETDGIGLVVNRAWYAQVWGDTRIDRLTLKLRPEADVNAVRRELLSAYALRGMIVLDANEMRAAFGKMMVSISTVSQLLSTLFGFTFLAGLAGTLLIMVIDRRRELGMMRAVGMLRRQLVMSILLESIILVIFGLVIAIPGISLTIALQRLSMESVMGIRFGLDPREVLIMIGVGIMVGLIAAYLPARSAGRTDVLEAMRYE